MGGIILHPFFFFLFSFPVLTRFGQDILALAYRRIKGWCHTGTRAGSNVEEGILGFLNTREPVEARDSDWRSVYI